MQYASQFQSIVAASKNVGTVNAVIIMARRAIAIYLYTRYLVLVYRKE